MKEFFLSKVLLFLFLVHVAVCADAQTPADIFGGSWKGHMWSESNIGFASGAHRYVTLKIHDFGVDSAEVIGKIDFPFRVSRFQGRGEFRSGKLFFEITTGRLIKFYLEPQGSDKLEGRIEMLGKGEYPIKGWIQLIRDSD